MATVSAPDAGLSPAPGPAVGVSGEVLAALALLALGVLPALFVLPHDRLVIDANLPLLGWLPLGVAGVLALDRTPHRPAGWVAVVVAGVTPLVMLVTTLPAGHVSVASGPAWVLPVLLVALAALPADGRAARRWRVWIAVWSVVAAGASYVAWHVGSRTTFGVVASLGLLAVAAALAASALAPRPRPPVEPLLDLALLAGVLTSGVVAGGVVWSFADHERIFGAEVVGALAAAVTLLTATPAAVTLRRAFVARRYGTGVLSPDDLAVLSVELGGGGDPRQLLTTANELVAIASGTDRVEIVLDEAEDRPGWLSYPLVVGDERVGTMSVLPRQADGLETRQEVVVQQLAPTVALAARAVDLAVQARHARDDVIAQRQVERARMLADLHDDLGPALAGLGMRVEAARAAGTGIDLDVLADDLTACRADLRRIVSALTPEPLVGADLAGALATLVESFATSDGPALSVDASRAGDVDGPRAIVAYRFVAEAVTNARRHANASRIDVTVQRTASDLEVEVADDGAGGPVVPGVGLTSLTARAREAGGTLTIGEAVGGGLVVRLELPGGHP